nr:unnamed protein product [Amyelois transitella]
MAKQDDGLFLLEVLIDKIVFVKSPCFTDKDFRTCVKIDCPGMEPLEICDDELDPCAAKSGGPFVKTFNSGKSCLFSLKESEISNAMSSFPIKICVYKALPCGCLPAKIVMGEATIDMTKEFVQARNKFLEFPNTVSYQALKDSFRIMGPDGAESGEIVMFLRISCFGKLIITKFQGAGGPPTLGGPAGASINDRSCNPQRNFQSSDDPCVCGGARGMPGGGGGAGGAGGPCPGARDPYNSMPCVEGDDVCYCSGPKPEQKIPMACRNTDQYCLHVPKGRSKQFEEIGTTLGDNELRIKVPATSSIIKKISQTRCSLQCPYAKGVDGGPCEPPCGKNQLSLALPSEATCCAGAQPTTTQFTCTTEGCTQISKHAQQAALEKGDTKDLPPTDCFVLKVGKTAMQGDRKCKLELELVTPSGPDKKPPVKKVDTRLQSDLDCECCVRRLKKPKGKKHCCPTGNKVVFQMPSDTCGMAHTQRAHFSLTSEGVGDVARDEPGQLMPVTAEDYPGVVYDFPSIAQYLNELRGVTTSMQYLFEGFRSKDSLSITSINTLLYIFGEERKMMRGWEVQDVMNVKTVKKNFPKSPHHSDHQQNAVGPKQDL